MRIQHFFDPRTSTLTYVVHDEDAKVGVVIDPVLDYEPRGGRIFHESVEAVAAYVDAQRIELPFALDTHCHADHLSALPWFAERYGSRTVIGAGIVTVQRTFGEIFGFGPADGFAPDGSQWDILLEDGAKLGFGGLELEAIPTGGHTPASLSYRIGDAVFVGDSLFMPDQGTARCDFPGGSAEELYESVQRLYALPPETRVFTLHDYQPGGRALRFFCTIAEARAGNIHLRDGVTRAEFVALRRRLEEGKELPTLLLPAVQVNIRGGRLPPPEANGRRYLKIPLGGF
jgi:glyoxylase-like metal-dependent hydrolase (beta-lactamase superfamily II)